jgi:hypothetical protein
MIILDGVLTNLLLKMGLAEEANPLLFSFAGTRRFIIFKVAGALLAALILLDISRHHPRLAFWTTSIALLFYSGIVGWNLSLLILGM